MKNFRNTLLISVLVSSLAACQPAQESVDKIAADLILNNGKIVSVDEAFSLHDTIVVTDGRVVELGDASLLDKYEAAIVRDLDVEGAVLFRSAMTDIGSPLDVAERAWPPGPLACQYEAFLSQLDNPAILNDAATTRRLLELVDTWRRFPLIDPDLPRELRPADWPGDRAAREFALRRSAWASSGADWWAAIERSFE